MWGDLFCPNVPEGRCDRSLARSAWESATPKDPSRRVRCDSCRCRHESIENVFGLTWAASLSRMERLLNALAASQTISISVSRSFRKRSIHLAAARTTWDIGISCVRSYRTLRDGSFEDALPGTSCQATIVCPYGTGLQTVRNGIY
jgi:hypothetical protein